MSGAHSGTSSGAAEVAEEALVVGNDAGDRRRLGCWIPNVEFESSAQKNSVGAWKHYRPSSGVGVAESGWGSRMASWPRTGLELLVAEQIPTSKAGAVEYQALGNRADIGYSRELSHLDPASGDLYVADHLPKIPAGLDIHRVVTKHAIDRKGMFCPAEQAIKGGGR